MHAPDLLSIASYWSLACRIDFTSVSDVRVVDILKHKILESMRVKYVIYMTSENCQPDL